MLVHATAVSIEGRAVLLAGPSGSGKSDLALRLVDRGAELIADDQVELLVSAGRLLASAPPAVSGLLEVRGIGIIALPTRSNVPCTLWVELTGEPERLPEPRVRDIGGVALRVLVLRPFEASAPLKVERALRQHALAVEAPAVSAPIELKGPRILLVTGMSGAGKSTALKALEDLGYEAVDNLPIGLLDKLLQLPDTATDHGADRPLAFGIDSRTRAFDADAIIERLHALRGEGLAIDLLFLDCAGGELTRRFSETRRRHPLALDRPASDGIAREREMLGGLRRWADVVIDTTDYATPDLKRAMIDRFGRGQGDRLTLTLMSFGFARGLPRDADLVFDMRFLANPHWEPDLRDQTGKDAAVGRYIEADPAFVPAVDRIMDLLLTLLPGYGREGKAYLTVAFGCTGGRHRSVYVVGLMAARLAEAGHQAVVSHRDLLVGGATLERQSAQLGEQTTL